MKTAYQTKAVANTTIYALIYKGEVAGHIVTGHTINGNGCTSTCHISKGLLVSKAEGVPVEGHCTMAGGGINFGSETRYYAVMKALGKLGIDLAKFHPKPKENPLDFLQRKGYKIVKLY